MRGGGRWGEQRRGSGQFHFLLAATADVVIWGGLGSDQGGPGEGGGGLRHARTGLT